MGRHKAVILVGITTIITSTLCALSQMPGSNLTILGHNLFDAFDSLSSNIMMPLGGLLIVIFTGWVLDPAKFKNELTSQQRFGLKLFPIVRFLIRFVIPVVILLLFFSLIGLF